MNPDLLLRAEISKAVQTLFNQTVDNFQIQPTNLEFEGSHTLVCFPLTKITRKGPEETAKLVGEQLLKDSSLVIRYNVVKGFLNLVLGDRVWIELFSELYNHPEYGQMPANGREIMIEYSSPNTNKPLHLGHLRNNFLGWSVSEIYKANGYTVHKVQIINDRGIHICKSMAAWTMFGEGETPFTSGIKGDHLVGKYYVTFEKAHRSQLRNLLVKVHEKDLSFFDRPEAKRLETFLLELENHASNLKLHESQVMANLHSGSFGPALENILKTRIETDLSWTDVLKKYDESEESIDKKERSKKYKELNALLTPVLDDEKNILQVKENIIEVVQNKTPMMQYAQELLRKWEMRDPDTLELWRTMNSWVYDGFEATYKKMGVDFDKLYYESETYLLGKEEVLKGVESGVFFKKEDGSVWVDLTSDGLDQKVLLRADGTSVYMTQDIGTAILRFRDFPHIGGQVYTVGNEQEYHFKVLFLILSKLGYEWAKRCYHLSYGMVDLPSGKMKSREGTVVDADDLMDEMERESEKQTREKQEKELGKLDDMSGTEARNLFHMLGMGALKFFLLKVDPKKRMLFDPNESIQLQGFTGPFIQYTHARIRAIIRRADGLGIHASVDKFSALATLEPAEREGIQVLSIFESKIQEAAKDYSPAVLANYAYELAKVYNQFYQSISIFNESDKVKLAFRIAFSAAVARAIQKSMNLLGIEVPERM
jgi:arginyl-tRNA synthetase